MDKPIKWKRVGGSVKTSEIFRREEKELTPEMREHIIKVFKQYQESITYPMIPRRVVVPKKKEIILFIRKLKYLNILK
jgi:hypothetical protein